MIDPVYVALSGQVALENRLKTISENVANAGTVGYRATQIRFEEVLNKKIGGGTTTVTSGTETISMAPGTIKETGGAFDFAINGEGWFGIQNDGGIALTRDGRFNIDSAGQLVSMNGDPVLDAGGAPVQLTGDLSALQVSADGVIFRDGEPVSGIGVFAVQSKDDLIRTDGNAFVSRRQPTPLLPGDDYTVLRGRLEMSNIDPISEIVQLITVQRTFEQQGALMRNTSDTIDRVIQSFTQ